MPRSAYANQRWLIQTEAGELLLIDGEDHLAHLLGSGRVTGAASVYEVGPGPRTLSQVPDLARVMSKAAPSDPPPVKQAGRSPEAVSLDEELAVLDRPLDYDIEYEDERPPRRGMRWGALLLGLVSALVGAYFLAAPRFPELRSLVVARVIQPVSRVVHALTDSKAAVPVAVPAVAPALAPAPAAPPAIQASAPVPAPSAQAAPPAAPEAPEAEAPPPARSAKRHAAKKHSVFRR